MPESAKEVAKVVVETSGAAMTWIAVAFATLGSAVVAMWKYISNRIGKVELDASLVAVIKSDFEKHQRDENAKFDNLFAKHDHLIETVGSIRESVARIEGKLDK